jgi:two-component system, NarL family, nitrate/nitrite response regulator NarL
MNIRLVLADDHPLLLDGLARLLEREPDMAVVARCGDGLAALEAVRQHRPDIVVVDLRMPVLGGLDVVRTVLSEGLGARAVVLAGELGEEELLEAVRLGVRGAVAKGAAPEALVRCIRTVHAGGQWLEGEAAGRVVQRLLNGGAGNGHLPGGLTPREAELVELVSQGLRNKEVAARLGISEGTVKIHLHRIYEKLGVTSRVELANYARQRGMGSART